ncbi:MAG: hypothetical protein QXU99_04945 [Candidatus Bathyarchaeia archaeon]
MIRILAYELFLKNKDWTGEFRPKANIKKIYVKSNGKIVINFDDKTLAEYGDESTPADLLKNQLQMPCDTLESVGLPFRGTGSNSPKAYVEFQGTLKKNTIALLVSGRQTQKITWKYTFDFAKNNENLTLEAESIKLRLDKEHYFVQNKPLYEFYVQDGVINSNGELSKNVFLEVCRKFINLCKEKNLKDKLAEYNGKENFRLVLLPYTIINEPAVEYREATKARLMQEFVDAFGVAANAYPSKSTQTAKFLSFDDPAFTLNCTRNQEFYRNLGIGATSFEKINMPPEGAIEISGLSWYLFDINDPTMIFGRRQSGFYDNLLSGYLALKNKRYSSPHAVAMLKILCVKKTQAKLEVLIDENLTLSQLNKILQNGNLGYCPMVFESLIKKRNQDVIWSDYINAIRFFIKGLLFERNALIKLFTQQISENLYDWLRDPTHRDSSFFTKSVFLIKLLTKEGEKMDKNEEYAYKIGKLAGKYVNLKKAAGEAGSSISDVLTYTKYDRERLRHVYKRVCLGAVLLKDSAKADVLNQFIKDNTPHTEIEDEKSSEDFSYWFYKGVFEAL